VRFLFAYKTMEKNLFFCAKHALNPAWKAV